MSALAPSGAPAGLLLVIAGIWLLLQTLVGGLAARIVALAGSSSTSGSAANAADISGALGAITAQPTVPGLPANQTPPPLGGFLAPGTNIGSGSPTVPA